jgi:hypothetical protein
MNTYTVNQVANRPRSDFPGYAQSFYAYDENDAFAGAHLDQGWDDKDPGNTFTDVMTRQVAAVDGHHAIMRFRQWQATGKPIEWLTNPDFLAQEKAAV